MIPTAMLIVHVVAGGIAFFCGAIALSVRKGARVHRASGTLFLLAMLIMSATAAYLSLLRQPGTFFVSLITLYLLATGWATVRRREGEVGILEIVFFVAALGCAAGSLVFAREAASDPSGWFAGYPAGVYYAWMALSALAAALDLKVILGGGISGAGRVARHLWRVCTAFFIGAASAASQLLKLLPDKILSVPVSAALAALALAPLLLMVFWLIRVRFTGWYRDRAVIVPHA